jgi:hypothetical protein
LCIERWDLGGFDDGVVVGPGLFEAMREELNGRIALASPDQKAGGSGAESTDGPKNIFHLLTPRCALDL